MTDSGRLRALTGGASVQPLVLIGIVTLTDNMTLTALGVLVPDIRDYFGVSLGVILTVQSLIAVMPILLGVPLGFLADRVRRSRLVGLGFLISGAFAVGMSLSVGVVMLALMLLGAGLGRAFEGSNQSFLADSYPLEKRALVFGVLGAMLPVASIVGPALSGVLGQKFGWQLPFLLFGLPTAVLALALFRLRDPARGNQERRALGASEEVANREEKPPGWTEGWRIAKSVRTLRRVWIAAPFLVGAGVVTASLMSVLYHDVFALSSSARGFILSGQAVAVLIGIVTLTPAVNRLLERSPIRVAALVGAAAAVQAACIVLAALSPWAWGSVIATTLGAFALAPAAPALGALVSLTCPPRARAFAQSFLVLFGGLGVLVQPFAAAMADSFGIRAGIALMGPVFLVGALLIATAGASVAADMRAAAAAAMASHLVEEARREGRSKLLVCRDVDAGYGAVQILFNLDLEVEAGEILALLGTNGAGKSTLLAAVNGTNPASNGAVFFDGEDITHLPAAEHVRRGIVSVPGGRGVFPTLTVAENLRLAGWKNGVAPDECRQRLAGVYDYFPQLAARRDEPAGNLSGGEQQMLALGQAFLSRPRLLLIDELSLGLAPAVIAQLLTIVRAIRDEGATVIVVEQSVNTALSVADRAVFMEKGEVRFSGPANELLGRTDILRSVFLAGSATATGRYATARAESRESQSTDVVLRAAAIEKSYGGVRALTGATIELRRGQTVGIIGANGAGKTTLFDAISGFVTPDSGVIELLGEDVTECTPDQRALRGLGRSFQDAKLFGSLSVQETLLVTLDRHMKSKNLASTALGLPAARRSEDRLRRRAERLIGLLHLEEFRDKYVGELSTGSRRLVDLACVLAADPDVLLLDEPSSGIAQKETEEMPALIERIKHETGCSIMIIEHDMQLVTAVADTLVAMELGSVLVTGAPDAVLADPKVIASYLGATHNTDTQQTRPRRQRALSPA